MARLTTGQRARLPARDFAGPGRSFPMPDQNHARAAIIDSGRAVRAGTISSSQATAIKARARKMLSGGK